MRKKKKINRNLVKDMPVLRKVTDTERLPYVFDLHFDAVYGCDLEHFKGSAQQPLIVRLLAEAGYDAKEWANR